jgi:hypothetical protein
MRGWIVEHRINRKWVMIKSDEEDVFMIFKTKDFALDVCPDEYGWRVRMVVIK